jgi:mannose-6-phosphate isomerase-like protein (cupin superfamily)
MGDRPVTVSLLVGSTDNPASVHGVHGAAGVTRWACLASRRDLSSHCEAVEWASVPPDGMSGEHRHTRTEESYFIIRGSGEILLNGAAQPVEPGSLVLTGIGATHGLRNIGATDLDWLVIECLSPATSAVLAGRSREQGEVPVSNALVVDMTREPSVETSAVFSGPLKRIELVALTSGQERKFASVGVEHTVFVLSGSALAVSGGTQSRLEAGHCVTVPLGGAVTIAAESERVELFTAVLSVDGPEEPQ